MCSNCSGYYEDPDATAYEIDGAVDLAPNVGYPPLETEKNSKLHQLLASAHTVYCTINLVDYLYGRSPMLPRRPYEWRFK